MSSRKSAQRFRQSKRYDTSKSRAGKTLATCCFDSSGKRAISRSENESKIFSVGILLKRETEFQKVHRHKKKFYTMEDDEFRLFD